MSDEKVAKVKEFNATTNSGFLEYEIGGNEVILPRVAVGSLKLQDDDEVTFEVVTKDGKYYATNVRKK